MHKAITILFVISSLTSFSQKYATVDIVKAKASYEKEALYFYEKNWKAFRAEAKRQKVISGYSMFRSPADSTGYFDITLITEYKNAAAHAQAEEKFGPIMKKISPNGPQYLNTVKREEFLKYIAGAEGLQIFGK